MKIGDKVMLKETSKFANSGSDNPTGVVGEIVGQGTWLHWQVRWGLDSINSYNEEDLTLVEETVKKEIDWSKAPEGATDYNSANEMWYKEDAEGVMSWWFNTRQQWVTGGEREDYNVDGKSPFISRPKEVKSMIGIKSGKNWNEAPDDATHVAAQVCGEAYNFYKREKGQWLFNVGENFWMESVNAESNWFNPISKQDDLQLETKPKYSSLQELPVGTFVKLNHEEDNTCIWTGRVLAQMNPSEDVVDCWDKAQVNNYEGFRYKFNSDFDIIAYSDKYDGEYTPIVKEQPTPQVIKDGWKIKHIKSPNYKCGRDVAVTILYREVKPEYYEYKYSICCVNDMFNRKVGIQTASDKTDSYYVLSHKENLFNTILSNIQDNNNVNEQFKLLRVEYYLNH